MRGKPKVKPKRLTAKRQPLRAEINKEDSLAQLVEHNTFNVGVLGSSPRRITKQSGKTEQNTATGSVAVFFLSVQMASECSLRGSAVCKSWTTQIVDIFVHD